MVTMTVMTMIVLFYIFTVELFLSFTVWVRPCVCLGVTAHVGVLTIIFFLFFNSSNPNKLFFLFIIQLMILNIFLFL